MVPQANMEAYLAQLRPELEKLGWTEGRNFAFLEPRTGGNDNARLPSLASELVAQSPDLILFSSVSGFALLSAGRTVRRNGLREATGRPQPTSFRSARLRSSC